VSGAGSKCVAGSEQGFLVVQHTQHTDGRQHFVSTEGVGSQLHMCMCKTVNVSMQYAAFAWITHT
jgi:hypothetical protein